jgi:hypothetical protein
MHDKDFQHALQLLTRTTPGSFHRLSAGSPAKPKGFESFHLFSHPASISWRKAATV